jgi:hypothetical protein
LPRFGLRACCPRGRAWRNLMEFSSAELPGLLDSVLSLLSRREATFAREFFFHGSDVPGNISIITNPASLAHASVAEAAFTMVAPRYAHPAAQHFSPTSLTKSLVLVPCFSASNVTVGACIAKADGDMLGKAGFVLNEIALGRFVRDEETSETLIILHSLRAHEVESPIIINSFRHVSSTAHESISIICKQEKFGTGPMADSVIAFCCANEVRHCPVCGKLPVSRCGCTIPMVPMRHSMDFESVSQNMATHHYARWTGTSNILFRKSHFDPNAPLMTFDLLWSHSFVASNDLAVFSQLRDSIVQRSLGSVAPTKTVVTQIETAVSYILATFVDGHAGKAAQDSPAMQIGSSGGKTSTPPDDPLKAKKESLRLHAPPVTSESTAARSSSTGAAVLAALWEDAARQRNDAYGPHACSGEAQQMCVEGGADAGRGKPSTCVAASSELTSAELRALMRKERNRAAAARSNEKRKLRLRKLREDVASVRRELVELNVRERILKSENSFLKKKVNLGP